MKPERFQRVAEVFLLVRQCEGAHEREALLNAQCAGDGDLLAQVRSLLEDDASSVGNGAFDSQVIGEVLRNAAVEAMVARDAGVTNRGARDPNINRRIGRYRIIRRLGEGGMGAVYQAEQDNPRRIVALKIIRPGLMSPSMLRRFQHEAQVLGRLHHPGIAQIYEAGADDSGEGAQPYFAMEYVDGQPLTAFVRERELNTSQRLELMASICDAVEHAHQRGVIHRDLKPGNILVAQEPADGLKPVCPVAKILDFGVARAIDSDIATTTLRTEVGQLVGTVSYMSPEQASGDPDNLDTRSDVYALGVICYEMLAGQPPHDLAKRSIPEAMRVIAENEPATLSYINRAFRGDIETMVAKALERDKARRYQSAAEFAADIRRYLRDEPIIARPASTIYQLRKFARRNKALVGGVVAVFIVLVLGIIGSSIGMTRALDEARKARRMNEYLKGMIAFLDPNEIQGQEITLRQVLEEASRRLDADLDQEPEISADLRDTLGEGFLRIGGFDRAEQHFRAALLARQQIHGDSHPLVADEWNNLGMALREQGKFDLAEQAHRAALEIRRARLGESLEVAESLNNLGVVMFNRQDLGEAKRCLRDALDMLSHVKPGDCGEAAQGLTNLANVEFHLGRVEESLRLAQESMSMRERLGIADTIEMSDALANLSASAVHFGGDPAQVLPLLQKSVDIRRRLLPPDHPDVAHALDNLALMYHRMQRYDLAIEPRVEALALRRRALADNDPELIMTVQRAGDTMLLAGRLSEAQTFLEEAVEKQPSSGPGRSLRTAAQRMLARCHVQQGHHAEAAPLFSLVLDAVIAEHGAKSQQAAAVAEELLAVYHALGESDKADAISARLAQD